MILIGLLCLFNVNAQKVLAADGNDGKVVIPFDFVSEFDRGHMGGMISDSIWKKLNREEEFILPSSMQDVRDLCKKDRLTITPDTSLKEMEKIVRERFEAQIGIWGSVERIAGTKSEEYEIVIKCVDFSRENAPKTIYEGKAQTKAVGEITHRYLKEMYDALGDKKSTPSSKGDSPNLAKEPLGPNLVRGGDFEKGTQGVPSGWEKVGGQKREPLGKLVQWIDDPTATQGTNKIIRLVFGASVGDNEGVMYYSEAFPVEEGAKYRFQCRFRSNGPNVKVFLKCYDDTNTDYRSKTEKTDRLPSPSTSSKNGSSQAQRREVYRCQMNLRGPVNQWNTHTEEFTPKHTNYTPKWGRVMLYAYLGAGQVDFDDVSVQQIAPPPSQTMKKERKHSSASAITIEEMEENKRSSDDPPNASPKP